MGGDPLKKRSDARVVSLSKDDTGGPIRDGTDTMIP